jgi:hypothetical protein
VPLPVRFGLNADPNPGGRAIAERITAMNAFVFWPSGDRERQSRVFAEDVVPAVRAAIAAA